MRAAHSRLVGVHRGIVVTATALHIDIGGEGSAPGGCDAYQATVAELPRVEVIAGLLIIT